MSKSCRHAYNFYFKANDLSKMKYVKNWGFGYALDVGISFEDYVLNL